MNKTKFNFLQQIIYAVTKPTKYYQITKTSGGRLTGFIFLFVFITSLFTIVPLLYYSVGPNGFTEYLNQDMPEFELSNGELNVAERFEKEDGRSYVLIDTDVNSFDSDAVDEIYYSVILLSKTNMVTYQNGRTQILKFSDFGDLHVDNSIMNVLNPLVYLVVFIVVIITYLAMVGFYFITALLYSLVGLIVSGATHATIKYSKIFKTAIYGKVTASILVALLSLIPLDISDIITTGLSILITCAYVVYGTLSHNSDEAREDNDVTSPPIVY